MQTNNQITQFPIRPENLWAIAQLMEPELCKRLLPKRYKAPITHSDPTFAAAHLFAGIVLQEAIPDNLPARYAMIAAARLIEEEVPTFFVTPDLLHAAMQADRPGSWKDILWPREAVLFILPKNTLHTPSDGPLGFLAVARNHAFSPITLPGRPAQATRQSSIMVCGASSSGNMTLFGANVQREHIRECERYPHAQEYDDALVQSAFGQRLERRTQNVEDKAFEFSMWRIAVALITMMTTHPELLREGRLDENHGARRRSERVWHPNWFGENSRPAPDILGSVHVG